MVDVIERKTKYKNVCNSIKTLKPCSLLYDNLNSYYTLYVKPVSIVDEIITDSNTKNSSSPDSILSSGSDSASEIFQLVNNNNIKIIQKNIYNNNMNFLYTELMCNICVNDIVLDNINQGFTLLYDYQFKSYNNPFNACKSNRTRSSIMIDSQLYKSFSENNTDNKYLKLLIEYADSNLSKLLRNNIDYTTEIFILKQIYLSIIAYSKFGIIHNDLFSRNILIKLTNVDLLSIISDFGYSLIDKDSKLLTNEKYRQKLKEIIKSSENENLIRDLHKCVNIINNYYCNVVINDIVYNNLTIYKKDIITITKSLSIESMNINTKKICDHIINDILNSHINSFDELINYIEFKLLSKSLSESILNGLTT